MTGSRHTCLSECNQPKSVLLSLAKKEQCAVSLKVPYRQVQKSDRIKSDRQSGSDQLRSTRIDSDRLKSWKKHEIKWNIETITHLKVIFRSKMGQIKKDSWHFSVSCCVVKPPFCILSTSSSHRLPKLKIRGVCHSFEIK